MKRKRPSVGFSLVEIILVALIISILFALLLPKLAGIADKARRASCANNMRLIVRALKLYSEDFDVGRPPGINLREWYGRLYYPKDLVNTGNPDYMGMQGGITAMKSFICPATKHAPPLPGPPGADGLSYGKRLVITALNASQDSENANYTGSSLDYWIIKGNPAASYYDTGYPYFRNPGRTVNIEWPDENAVLWETSDNGTGRVHHENGRNIAFKSEAVKFIASWDTNLYPKNLLPTTGVYEVDTIAVGGINRYVHSAQ